VRAYAACVIVFVVVSKLDESIDADQTVHNNNSATHFHGSHIVIVSKQDTPTLR
jgi:hypothetical protein